jgi:preprotein translocase subunit SecE
MNLKETQSSPFDKVKWLLAIVLLAGGIFAFYYYAQLAVLYRILGIIVVVVVAAVIALQTAKGRYIWSLWREARNEIRKVVWPSRQEAIQMTLIVLAIVILMALILWGLDSLIAWLVSLLIS